jgi:chromosome segregation ATPase
VFGMTSISGAIPSAQLGLYQFKLQQARSEAAQAQEEVRALEAQTNQARQSAAQSQENVRSLESQSPLSRATLNTSGQFTGSVLSVTA